MKALENATQGTLDVAAERMRQITDEGYTQSHDALYTRQPLISAALCYAEHSLLNGNRLTEAYRLTEPNPYNWPWNACHWKPTTPRRDLVKAAALIIAEIDRMDAEQKEKAHE